MTTQDDNAIQLIEESVKPVPKVLYDGSLDVDVPNNLLITTDCWIRGSCIGSKRIASIKKIEVYKKYIIFSHTNEINIVNDTNSSDSLDAILTVLEVVSKETARKSYSTCFISDHDKILSPLCFMYDHLPFVTQVMFNTLYCCQPTTDVNTRIESSLESFDQKTFELNGLNMFIGAWHKLPFGSKRRFDPSLLECPKTIYSRPFEVIAIKYCREYCDLLTVCDS